jgi:hypothetical protein
MENLRGSDLYGQVDQKRAEIHDTILLGAGVGRDDEKFRLWFGDKVESAIQDMNCFEKLELILAKASLEKEEDAA